MSQTEQRLQKRYEFGSFTLEPDPLCLFQNGVEVPIRSKGREILLLLVENAGQMVEKEEILNRVWPERAVEESNLSQHVHLLRRALEDNTKSQDYILTIPGKGYLFNHEVRVVTRSPNRLASTGTDQPDLSAEGDRSTSTEPLAPQSPATLSAGRDGRRRFTPQGVKGLVALLAGVTLVGAGILFWWWRSGRWSTGPTMLTSGVVLPMVTLPGVDNFPRFSPNGQYLAFSSEGNKSGSSHIFIQRIEDGQLTQLTNDARSDVQPNWSPDSSQIAFLRDPVRSGAAFDAMIVDAQGGEPRLVSRSWGGLTWSPDGKHLVITVSEDGVPQSRLGLVPIQGGSVQRMGPRLPPKGPNFGFFETHPRFSYDGKSLAFVRWMSNINADLYILDLQTRATRRLTTDETLIPTFEWTADSKEIIFSSDRRRPRRMWRIAVEGGDPVPIDLFPFDIDYLTVHPSGKMIAFTQSRTDSVIKIGELSASSTSSSSPCMINSSFEDDTARFSPNGEWVVFHSTRSGFHELWVARSDCSQVRQLTRLQSKGLGSPRWSPDGSRIAFDHHVDGNAEIFTIRSDGRELSQLTKHPLPDLVPSWSRDGAWIYFHSGRSALYQIWKVRATGGTPIQVTFKGGLEALESEDGKTLYYTRGDRLRSLDFATGVEAPIPELAEISVDRHWDMTKGAIFFAPIQPDGRSRLHRFDLTTRRITPLFELEKTLDRWLPRFAISPDEKKIATYFYDYRIGDILVLKEQAK